MSNETPIIGPDEELRQRQDAERAQAYADALVRRSTSQAVPPVDAPKVTPAKKAAPKKVVAKKAVPKKAVAKKAVAKKAVAKKAVAKKAVAKKGAPKK